jgi:hypothetical protein
MSRKRKQTTEPRKEWRKETNEDRECSKEGNQGSEELWKGGRKEIKGLNQVPVLIRDEGGPGVNSGKVENRGKQGSTE